MALISGIQQIGIGCVDATKTFTWLRKAFGLNVKIFDDEARAVLMRAYTGGDVHDRRAILAMNMNGGGGAEMVPRGPAEIAGIAAAYAERGRSDRRAFRSNRNQCLQIC